MKYWRRALWHSPLDGARRGRRKTSRTSRDIFKLNLSTSSSSSHEIVLLLRLAISRHPPKKQNKKAIFANLRFPLYLIHSRSFFFIRLRPTDAPSNIPWSRSFALSYARCWWSSLRWKRSRPRAAVWKAQMAMDGGMLSLLREVTTERRAVRTRNRKWFFIERWLRGNVRLAENRAIDTDKPAGSAEEIKYVSRRVITGCDQLLCAARTPIAPPLSALRSRLPKATLISSAVDFIYFFFIETIRTMRWWSSFPLLSITLSSLRPLRIEEFSVRNFLSTRPLISKEEKWNQKICFTTLSSVCLIIEFFFYIKSFYGNPMMGHKGAREGVWVVM